MTKQAATLYRAVEHYLAGCENDGALEHWRLAIGTGLAQGKALDRILGEMGQLYTRKFGTR